MDIINQSSIKVVCISDTHNKADQIKMPKGDVLIHGGDFTLSGLPQEVAKFNDFLKQSPFEVRIVIAGNHDLTFDTAHYSKDFSKRFHSREPPIDPIATKALLKDCVYLEDSSYNLQGYQVYGSPYSPTFFDWGFNLQIGPHLQQKWNNIPLNTDILITHGPPHKILDKCKDGFRAGCPDLAKIVLEKVKPLYHIFGHIHEDRGQQKVGETTFINASSLNYNYRPYPDPPITFSLPFRN